MAGRLARNVAMLHDSVANTPVESRYTVRKLQSKAGDKLSCAADVATTTRDEEISSEDTFAPCVYGQQYEQLWTSPCRLGRSAKKVQLSGVSVQSYISRTRSTRVPESWVGAFLVL